MPLNRLLESRFLSFEKEQTIIWPQIARPINSRVVLSPYLAKTINESSREYLNSFFLDIFIQAMYSYPDRILEEINDSIFNFAFKTSCVLSEELDIVKKANVVQFVEKANRSSSHICWLFLWILRLAQIMESYFYL